MNRILNALVSILLLSFTYTTAFAQTADFVDSHDDGVIDGWTIQGNRSWSEQNGSVTPQNSGNDQTFLISDFEATSDGAIEVDIDADQWNGHAGGIILRWTSPQSYYFISVRPGNQWDNFIKFCKNTTIADSGLTVASRFSMNPGFTLRVELEGSTFRFFIDGELRGEVVDTDHPSGGFGYAYGPVWNSYISFEETRWWNQAPTEYELSVTVDGNGSVEPESGSFPEGTEVELVATADQGWAFSHWSGDMEGTENPAAIVMNSEKNVTAHFEEIINHTLTLETEGSGEVDLDPAGGEYPQGTEVTVTASPLAGWQFSHWSGDIASNENPAAVIMDSPKSVTAHFVQIPTYELTVTVEGNGSVIPDGGNYSEGTEVEMTATADDGWVFSHWRGDLEGSANPVIVVMDAPKAVTANFVQIMHMVNIMTEGNGTVTPQGGEYPEGTELTLQATADEGWRFTHWSGDLEGTENPAMVSVDGEKFIVANFEQITYDLTVLTEGTGTVSPQSGTYPYGDEVEITATAGEGWIFSSWSGDITGSTNPAVVVMDGPKTVTATFVQQMVDLTVTVDGYGGVSPQNATVPEGSTVEITATPDDGYVFDRWSGDITGTENPVSVVMDTDKQIQAHFVEYVLPEYSLTVGMEGNGTVTPESGTFLEGTEIEMNATADEGWVFSHWEGDMEGRENPTIFTINSDMIVSAVFVLDNEGIPNSRKICISARLFDHNDQPIGNDLPESLDVIINLYAQETDGEVLYSEEFLETAGQAITVEDGYLVARLGEGATTDILDEVISANDDLWVEIVARGNTLPRVPMTAAPYSLR